MTPYSLRFRAKSKKYPGGILTPGHYHIEMFRWVEREGLSGLCQIVIILQLGTYHLRIPRHKFAAIGVGELGIRSSHVKISGRSSLGEH